MESCLGEINRKMSHSRSPLMTRREHPEQTWYQIKNTSKPAAKRYAGFHSKRSGTFNLYQAGEDQEMQETGISIL